MLSIDAGVHSKPRETGPQLLRWAARFAAILLALFWGAFFIEHLNEWYRGPDGFPPAWVTLAMAFHLAMILGLLASARWWRAGCLVTILATAGFMFAAGAFIPLVLINLAPAVGYAAAHILSAGPHRPPGPAPR